MDKPAFYAALRKRDSGVFGTSLSQAQVDGCESILEAARTEGIEDIRHVANVLAQVYHETGGYMLPIKETVMPHHKDKNPSDATVISRLNNAYSRGQLPWVNTPYWRDGWFGRGQIQITHRRNYEKLGDRLGVNLVADRDKALDPEVSARIAVVGMAEGIFTGRRLADYFSDGKNDVRNARGIVNGPDDTEDTVTRYHMAFLAALDQAGWTPPAKPQESGDDGEGEAEPGAANDIDGLLMALKALLRKTINMITRWMESR